MLDQIKAEEREQIKPLLQKCGSPVIEDALTAQKSVAAAVTPVLRKGVLTGNIIGDIFTQTVFDTNARIEYPIDLFRPDNDGEFAAFTIPNQGHIPQRHVEGDYVTVPTFDIGAGIDFLLRYAKEARFDVVGRALEVMEAGFVKKMNDDGWHTLLAAGVDRNIVVSDSNAAAGQFTKRLMSLIKLTVRRNAGGNSNSVGRGKLTHLFMSPESVEDVRNWGLDEIDDVSRREIFMAGDGKINEIYGVRLVDLDELGESQEYQDYLVNTLSASMAASDLEFVIGLDLANRDSFVMPIREELSIFEDPTLHRQRRMGFYGWAGLGYAALDSRRILLASL